MKNYKITVTAYIPVPRSRDYNITASSFGTAISRAIKTYRKEIGRKQIAQMTVSALK